MTTSRTMRSLSLAILNTCFLFLLLGSGSVLAKDSNSLKSFVTCGSAIKLKHVESGSYLYSENARNQGGGSGQQLVTFSPHHVNSEKTLWWLHGSSNENCTTATPIACGSVVRLSHVPTKRNLHSHNVVSSLSRQQEVTAWGDNYEGDGGDDWKVVCPTRYWERTTTVRLWHRDTQRYLGAASNVNYNVKNCGQECPILDHLEAFGRKQADEYGDFQVESGLFIGG